MISSLACICGGVGEIALGMAIFSGVAWLWRKLRGKKAKPHKHSDACKIKGSHTHM